jgi:L-threonylcarbamoyladenylate synthase
LLRAFGNPIAAPSANRYQGLSPTRAEHVVQSLGEQVDLILDAGPCTGGIESTVLDLTGEAPVVLRPGTIGLAALQSVDAGTKYAMVSKVAEAEPRPSPGMDARHYAPRAPLCLAACRGDAIAEASARVARGETVGLVLCGGATPDMGAVAITSVILPRDPASYARALYATLHDLDARVTSIVVEAVPEGDSWRAVVDRLTRASTPRDRRQGC